MAHKRKPRKPANPYGYINFPKHGPPEKRMFRLSAVKEEQELQVVNDFVQRLHNLRPSFSVCEIVDLPEADHDFLLRTEAGDITLQLTEIPERDYTISISQEEYNSGKYPQFSCEREWCGPPSR